MSATRKTVQHPHQPGAMSDRPCDDPLWRGAVQNCGERSNDANASLLLDALMQRPPGASCPVGTLEFTAAILMDQGSSLDDLIEVSAKMRGLIFRAYARRISDLMLVYGTVDLAGPHSVTGGTLH